MKISFSSLSTPSDWTLDRIIKVAGEAGFDGIELRCDYGQKHGISAGFRDVPKTTSQQISATLKMLKSSGVEICLLGTSVTFASTDPEENKKNIDEAKEYIVLADKLNCGMMRVFGGRVPASVNKKDAAKNIAKSLSEIGHFAEDHDVCPVIEQHDDWRQAEDLVMIMKEAGEANLGVNWHLRENDDQSLKLLGSYLKHTHIRFLAPFLLDTMGVLKGIGYEGYLSFEGGRGQNPDVVLKECAAKMREYLKKL